MQIFTKMKKLKWWRNSFNFWITQIPRLWMHWCRCWHIYVEIRLVFCQELSKLIFHHALLELVLRSVEREFHSQVDADIMSKAWVFLALIKWYLDPQVSWVIDRVTVPYVVKSEMYMLPAPVKSDKDIVRQEAQWAKKWSDATSVTERIVYTVCSNAVMLPTLIYDLINNLTEILSDKVKVKQFYTDSEVFDNLEGKE